MATIQYSNRLKLVSFPLLERGQPGARADLSPNFHQTSHDY